MGSLLFEAESLSILFSKFSSQIFT